MALNPQDIAYLRSRESLLVFEDNRLRSLLNAIPNFYLIRNDQSLFGAILRAVAIELAKLEYAYLYDLVAGDPNFLTPADIKRRLAAPNGVSNDYPTDTQDDKAYKTMLVNLTHAYKEGATLDALQKVASAYMAKPIAVEELYTLIGVSSGYDATVRNTLRSFIDVGSFDSVNNGVLQATIYNIYRALDLAKPAHVGLDLITVLGNEEGIDTIIDAETDALDITYKQVELQPLDPMFTFGPTLNSDSPQTELAAMGVVVGSAFIKYITGAAYDAMGTAFKAEYSGPDESGNYTLNLASYTDVALTTGVDITAAQYASLSQSDQATYTLGADGNYFQYTGEISKATGVLAPQLNQAWEITSDALTISYLT